MYNSIRLRCIHQTKPQRMAKESEVSYSMNTKKHTAQITIPVTALIIGLLLLLSCFMPEEAGAYSQKDLQYALENYQLSPPAYSYNINAENPKLTTGTPRFKKPVSYTHLDVYKRQLLSHLSIYASISFSMESKYSLS